MPPIGIREIDLCDVPTVARLPLEGETGADSPERMRRYPLGEQNSTASAPAD